MLLGVNGVSALIPALSAFAFGQLLGALRGQDSMSTQQGFTFWLCCALVLLLTGVLCRIASSYVSGTLSRELDLRISHDVLLHAATLDQTFFEDPGCQDKLSRARNQPGKTCFNFIIASVQAASGTVQVCSIFAVLFWIDGTCGLFLAVLGVPTFLIHRHLTRLRYEAELHKTSKRRWVTYYLKSCTSHVKTPTLKIFDLFPLMAGRFAEIMGELNGIDAETGRKQAKAYAGEAAILVLGLFAAATWTANRTFSGSLSVEGFATFWVAAAQFRNGLPAVQGNAATAFEMMLHVRDLRAFFAERPEIAPHEGAKPERLTGELSLRDAGFTYRGGCQPAVQGVNLQIHAGETVAIVGPNGAGKTTLAKLVLRLYNVSEGEIAAGDHDLRDLNLNWYHRQVAYVGHFPINFEATVAECIGYGDWRNLLQDPDRITSVADALGLHPMIAEMPQGYETRLGCRFGDYELSAGQWQKIAIARALARNPAILILDEPTANLDARYEFELLSALRHLTANRTTVIISHRLSTLQMADRIIVMDEGRIVDTGCHHELIAREGIYAQLYRTQDLKAA